jgi:hypothetical protein
MERITVLKDYGDDLVLIAVSGRCEWTPDAQVRLAKRVNAHAGSRFDPVSMDPQLADQLQRLGFNVCRH